MQRQSRGITVERVASQLHLKADIVEALEQDRFDLLPDPVFVMGYMRNYARALGLDPAPLIAAYQSQAGIPQIKAAPAHSIQSAGPDSGSGRLLVRLISLALVAAVIAMIVLWWKDMPEQTSELAPGLSWESTDSQSDPLESGDAAEAFDADAPRPPSQPTRDSVRTEPVDPLPGAHSSAPLIAVMPGAGSSDPASAAAFAQPRPEPEPASEPAPASSLDGGDRPPSSDPVQSATAEALDATRVQTPAGAGADISVPASTGPGDPEPTTAVDPAADAAKGIVLEFNGPSWLTVTDAAGTTLFNSEMKDGDRHPVAGQAPFRFVIGRVENTRMTLDGQPVDLQSRARGGVARFSFNPESPE